MLAGFGKCGLMRRTQSPRDDGRMPRFNNDNTFGYEPAGIKLLNKTFDKVVEALAARPDGGASREDEIAQTVLDVCYEDHGNIDAADLARQVLTRLGYG